MLPWGESAFTFYNGGNGLDVGRCNFVLFNINYWSYNNNGLRNIGVYSHGGGRKSRSRVIGLHNYDGLNQRSGFHLLFNYYDGFDRLRSFN